MSFESVIDMHIAQCQMRQRPKAARDRVTELLDGDGGRDSEASGSRPSDMPPVLARHEQEEVLAGLRATLVSHARWWRTALGSLGLALAAGFAYFAIWQAASPWTAFRHHAELKGTLAPAAVVIAEAASGAAIGAAAAALLRHVPAAESIPGLPLPAEKLLLRRAAQAAAATGAFWVWSIVAAAAKARIDGRQALRLSWLPALPAGFVALAHAVVRQYADMAERLRGLEAHMYNHEGA